MFDDDLAVWITSQDSGRRIIDLSLSHFKILRANLATPKLGRMQPLFKPRYGGVSMNRDVSSSLSTVAAK